MNLPNILLYLFSAGLGAFGAIFISTYGFKLGLMDVPCSRSSHSKCTPKGGGVGIVGSLTIGSIYLSFSYWFWAPLIVLGFVSLKGDKTEISPKIRLFFQFASSGSLLYWLMVCFGNKNSVFDFDVYVFMLTASIFIVGSANLYNFMDGINGIAAISGIIGYFLLGSYGMLNQENDEMIKICFVLVASCIGFLPLNFPNARVFMGDVGSIILGFCFAIIVLAFSTTFLEFILLVSFLFPFFIDEFITLLERIKLGENLFKPHRMHLYQVLVNEYGINHWKISMIYGIAQLLVGITMWTAFTYYCAIMIPLLMLYVGCSFALSIIIKSKKLT